VPSCRNNSKIQNKNCRKRQNQYRIHTNTWPLTFMSWYMYLNKKWRSYTSLTDPNLPSWWKYAVMQVFPWASKMLTLTYKTSKTQRVSIKQMFFSLNRMKSVILVMVAVLMLMSWECHQAEAVLCPDIGWGGCADGGCYQCGGYCVNHGRPPNNNCICENRSARFHFSLDLYG
jgi:hypothetical protein